MAFNLRGFKNNERRFPGQPDMAKGHGYWGYRGVVKARSMDEQRIELFNVQLNNPLF